jgi:Holliday junction resolvase RusA-like endonuclease
MSEVHTSAKSPLTITVMGVPIPKGSTKAFYIAKLGRAITTADNRRSGPWQESVVDAAQKAIGDAPPLEGALVLTLRFYLPRPKTAPKRVVDATKKPDLDKLVRCVKDGLTRAGLYRDDAQVVATVASKHFAGGIFDPVGEKGVPRAVVIVGALFLPALPTLESQAPIFGGGGPQRDVVATALPASGRVRID